MFFMTNEYAVDENYDSSFLHKFVFALISSYAVNLSCSMP